MKKKPEVIEIPLSKLLANSIQPEQRHKSITEKTPLTQLIKESELISPLVVVRANEPGMYIICDGHRRRAAAEVLGYDSVLCYVAESLLAAEDLIALLNSGTVHYTAEHHFQSWATIAASQRDHHVKVIGRGSRTLEAHIRGMVTIFGKTRAVDIGRKGKTSPAIQQTIKALHEIFENTLIKANQASKKKDESPDLLEIGEYLMVSSKRQAQAKAWLKTCSKGVYSVRRFISSIRQSKDFDPSQWIN